MNIRSIKTDDFAAIQKLAEQLAAHTEDPVPVLNKKQLVPFFFKPGAPMNCVVAEDSEGIAGMILWMLHFDLYSAACRVFIADLCVDERARGSKIGQALFAYVVEWAQQQGASKITWEVWRLNQTAKGFYSRQGAAQDHEVINYSLPLPSPAGTR